MRKRLIAVLIIFILAVSTASVTVSFACQAGIQPDFYTISGMAFDNEKIKIRNFDADIELYEDMDNNQAVSYKQKYSLKNTSNSQLTAKAFFMVSQSTVFNTQDKNKISLSTENNELSYKFVPTRHLSSFSLADKNSVFENSEIVNKPLGDGSGYKQYTFPASVKNVTFISENHFFAYGISEYQKYGYKHSVSRHGDLILLIPGEAQDFIDESGNVIEPEVKTIDDIYIKLYEQASIYSILDEKLAKVQFDDYLYELKYEITRNTSMLSNFVIYDYYDYDYAVMTEIYFDAWEEKTIYVSLRDSRYSKYKLNVGFLVPPESCFTRDADFNLYVYLPMNCKFSSPTDFESLSGSSFRYSSLATNEQHISMSFSKSNLGSFANNFDDFIDAIFNNPVASIFTLLVYAVPIAIAIFGLILCFFKPKNKRYFTRKSLAITGILIILGSFASILLSLIVLIFGAWLAGVIMLIYMLIFCYIPAALAIVIGASVNNNKYNKEVLAKLIANATERESNYNKYNKK